MALPLVIVVAVAENGVIGKDNGLSWRMPSDLKRFRRITMGKPLIMGRKTFQSIGRPLPGREIVVVTRDGAFRAEGVHVVHSPREAVVKAQELAAKMGADEIIIAGGAAIYAALLAMRVAHRSHARSRHDRGRCGIPFASTARNGARPGARSMALNLAMIMTSR